MPLLRIFFTGMFISFLGTLPLGTLNISAMQISVSDGVRPAFYFALGALLVEMIYVRLSLVAMNWVRKQKRLLLISGMGYAPDYRSFGSGQLLCRIPA